MLEVAGFYQSYGGQENPRLFAGCDGVEQIRGNFAERTIFTPADREVYYRAALFYYRNPVASVQLK
jgi:hypothetical protein